MSQKTALFNSINCNGQPTEVLSARILLHRHRLSRPNATGWRTRCMIIYSTLHHPFTSSFIRHILSTVFCILNKMIILCCVSMFRYIIYFMITPIPEVTSLLTGSLGFATQCCNSGVLLDDHAWSVIHISKEPFSGLVDDIPICYSGSHYVILNPSFPSHCGIFAQSKNCGARETIIARYRLCNTQQWCDCWKRRFLCGPCWGYIMRTSCHYGRVMRRQLEE
jgi:hypothetical protein